MKARTTFGETTGRIKSWRPKRTFVVLASWAEVTDLIFYLSLCSAEFDTRPTTLHKHWCVHLEESRNPGNVHPVARFLSHCFRNCRIVYIFSCLTSESEGKFCEPLNFVEAVRHLCRSATEVTEKSEWWCSDAWLVHCKEECHPSGSDYPHILFQCWESLMSADRI
jgi:hypothetical protein